MKPLIGVVSRTGNTQKVAEAVAKVLDAELRPAEDLDSPALAERPLVGLGSGIYWLGHDREVCSLASRIPVTTPVFTITTSGFRLGFLVRIYQWRLRRKLQKRGVKVVGELYSPGHDKFVLFRWMGLSKGRPDARDLTRAQNFAQELATRPE